MVAIFVVIDVILFKVAVFVFVDFHNDVAVKIEMKYRAFAKGFHLVEIPIIFKDRTRGKSKMSAGIIREAIFGVVLLRFKKMFGKL